MKRLIYTISFLTFSCSFLVSQGQASLKHTDNSKWLIDIADTVSIADINLPGSHDAAAIKLDGNSSYACHNKTITGQLESGIRILDIRLKVKGDSPNYNFVTCHGDVFGGSWGFNEYQSFSSVLVECKNFLSKYPSEFIVMSLKIDDWNSKQDKANVYAALHSLLFSDSAKYPVYNTTDTNLPSLGNVRGKIYLVNRIDNSSNELGMPLAIPDKQSAMLAPVEKLRAYPIYVQDQYEVLASPAEETKLVLVEKTFDKKKHGDGVVVLNFATGREGLLNLSKVYIQDKLLAYFGAKNAADRPVSLGWVLFDYESWAYKTDVYNKLDIVEVIIASNFGYSEYPAKFKVLSGGHL